MFVLMEEEMRSAMPENIFGILVALAVYMLCMSPFYGIAKRLGYESPFLIWMCMLVPVVGLIALCHMAWGKRDASYVRRACQKMQEERIFREAEIMKITRSRFLAAAGYAFDHAKVKVLAQLEQ